MKDEPSLSNCCQFHLKIVAKLGERSEVPVAFMCLLPQPDWQTLAGPSMASLFCNSSELQKHSAKFIKNI